MPRNDPWSRAIPVHLWARVGNGDLRMTETVNASLKGFLTSLVNPRFVPTGLRVALVVGSLLFMINHGSAALRGKMSRDRWISALLTYCVPYFVSIHGQYTGDLRKSS